MKTDLRATAPASGLSETLGVKMIKQLLAFLALLACCLSQVSCTTVAPAVDRQSQSTIQNPPLTEAGAYDLLISHLRSTYRTFPKVFGVDVTKPDRVVLIKGEGYRFIYNDPDPSRQSRLGGPMWSVLFDRTVKQFGQK